MRLHLFFSIYLKPALYLFKTSGNVSISSDSTDEVVSFARSKQLARVLRLFSVTSASQTAPPTTSYLTSRIFLPARTGSRSFENMVETMERVDAWLRVTGIWSFTDAIAFPIYPLYHCLVTMSYRLVAKRKPPTLRV